MMGPGMMGGFGWGWFMPIGMILFWGLVILPSSGSSRELDSALEVLKRRYARGEISKEEFEEKRKDLV
ncbi:MAG: SHOCT domain-containing protein [Chloroflexi bacterium]|nr:SHOCT domain-containing protein [Chloroflexota bacterium]